MVSLYTQIVRLMELLEMVLPREIVITARCVKPMGYAKVHYANFLFTLSGLMRPILFDAINCVVIFFDIILCLECSTDNDCSGGKICFGGYCSKFNP